MGGKAWTPIGTYPNNFSGCFDGGNHTVTNMVLNITAGNTGATYCGLFGSAGSGAVIHSVHIGTGSSVSGLGESSSSRAIYAGGIVGNISDGAQIYNCTNSASISAYSVSECAVSNVGGIAGSCSGVIYNCANKDGTYYSGEGNISVWYSKTSPDDGEVIVSGLKDETQAGKFSLMYPKNKELKYDDTAKTLKLATSLIDVTITPTDKTVAYADTIDIAAQGLFDIPSDAGAATYTVTNGTGEGTLSGTTLTGTKVGTFTVQVDTLATDTHKSAAATATLTVGQATPTVTTNPTAGAITYGKALRDSTLTGGEASVDGSFAWTDNTTQPEVSDSGITEYSVTFTPTDTTKYTTAVCDVKLAVNPAVLTVTPNALSKTYGEKDPALTCTVTGVLNSQTAAFGGALTRAEGEGKGDYAVKLGTLKLADGTGFDVEIDTPAFTGQPVTPDVTITYGGETLTVSTDYTADYSNNTAKVKITFIGNYSGSVEKTFSIVNNPLPESEFETAFGVSAAALKLWHKEDIVLTAQSGRTIGTDAANLGKSVTLSDEGAACSKSVYVKLDGDDKVYLATITYALDKKAPTVSDLTPSVPEGTWTKNDITVGFAVGDDTSGVAAVQLKKGSGALANCTNVSGGKHSFTAEENAAYTVIVTDAAGNTAEKSITVANIDKTAPTAGFGVLPTVPSSGWFISDVTIPVSVSDDNLKEWYYSTDDGVSYSFRAVNIAGKDGTPDAGTLVKRPTIRSKQIPLSN